MSVNQPETSVKITRDVQVLDTAILLTDRGLFSTGFPVQRYADSTQGSVGPLTKVGGLTLFQRAVLTLQRGGISTIIILAGSEEEALRRIVQDDPRIRLSLRWRPVREFPPHDPKTWEGLAAEVRGGCVIVGVQAVFSKGLVERLRHGYHGREVALVVRSEADGIAREAAEPVVRIKGDRIVSFQHEIELPMSDHLPAADLVAAPLSLFREVAVRPPDGTEPPFSPLAPVLAQWAQQGRVRAIHTTPAAPDWYQPVRKSSHTSLAERTLFRGLKGDFEGLVDRYVNRPVSVVLSKVFLSTGLSANAITMLSMMLGLVAAIGFGFGAYAVGVAAALLFQLSVVIDCCDGDVARLTFTESKFGEQLDITADNIVHMAIFAALGIGVFFQQGGLAPAHLAEPWWWVPLALGGVAVFANGVSFWLVNRAKAYRERTQWVSPEQAVKVEAILKNVASRDFSVILLVFALIGHLDWFLWLVAVGSNAFWMTTAWVVRPFRPLIALRA